MKDFHRGARLYAFLIAMSDLCSFFVLSIGNTAHFAHCSHLYSELIPLTCLAQKHSNVKRMIYAFQKRPCSKVCCGTHRMQTGVIKQVSTSDRISL